METAQLNAKTPIESISVTELGTDILEAYRDRTGMVASKKRLWQSVRDCLQISQAGDLLWRNLNERC